MCSCCRKIESQIRECSLISCLYFSTFLICFKCSHEIEFGKGICKTCWIHNKCTWTCKNNPKLHLKRFLAQSLSGSSVQKGPNLVKVASDSPLLLIFTKKTNKRVNDFHPSMSYRYFFSFFHTMFNFLVFETF